jgi:hypothetical protein
MKNRLDHPAADGSSFVGNRVTIPPFTTRINVADLDSRLNLNTVVQHATDYSGDLGTNWHAFHFRHDLTLLHDIANIAHAPEQPLLGALKTRVSVKPATGAGTPVSGSAVPFQMTRPR